MFNDLLQKIAKSVNGPSENHPRTTHSTSSQTSHLSRSASSEINHSARSASSTIEQSTFSDLAEMAPQTIGEFIDIIKNTPKSVLSDQDRRRIAAVMSFDDRRVRDLMIPRGQMIFVHDTEILGPLMLDKLYKSGFNVFPVVDSRDHVLGLIHTEALNTLEVRDTDRATKYLNPEVEYLHVGDSLKAAISEIERTGQYYFLVLDELDTLAGFFTIKQLLDYLLN